MSMRVSVAVALAALAGCGGSGGGGSGGGGSGGEPTTVSPLGAAPGVTDDAPGTGAPTAEADAAPSESPPPSGSSESLLPPPSTIAMGGAPLPSVVDERLRSVFDLVNGDAVERSVAVARRLIDVEVGPREGFTFSRSGIDGATGVEDTTLLCPEGGTLDTSSSSLLSSDGTFVLRGCGIGPLLIDGRIEGRVRGPERETDGEVIVEPSYEFDAFSVVDTRDGRTVSIDSVVVRPYTDSTEVAGGDVPSRFGYGLIASFDRRPDVGPGSIFERRSDGRAYTAVGGLRTIPRDDPTIDFPLGGMAVRFDVRFGDEEAKAEVRTTVPFTRLDSEERFVGGALTVTGDDYVYTLDADDGDPATFRLDVTEDDVTTSYTVPWSDAIGFDAFEPEGVDLGF